MSDPVKPARRGRKPEADVARDHAIRVRVSEDELKRLKAAALVNGQDVSDFIRDAVNEAAAECMEGPSVFNDD